jgi:hypothetical protein
MNCRSKCRNTQRRAARDRFPNIGGTQTQFQTRTSRARVLSSGVGASSVRKNTTSSQTAGLYSSKFGIKSHGNSRQRGEDHTPVPVCTSEFEHGGEATRRVHAVMGEANHARLEREPIQVKHGSNHMSAPWPSNVLDRRSAICSPLARGWGPSSRSWWRPFPTSGFIDRSTVNPSHDAKVAAAIESGLEAPRIPPRCLL